MKMLRIRPDTTGPEWTCHWAICETGHAPVGGNGQLGDIAADIRRLPRVQLLIPATQALIRRTRLPQPGRRQSGPTLAYSVEGALTGDPDAYHVCQLGRIGDEDILAIVDKGYWRHWLDSIAAAGIHLPEVHCEALMVPWTNHQWSVVWNGMDAIVRFGRWEGIATDCGSPDSPPLALQLLLEQASHNEGRPEFIALYLQGDTAAPNLSAWQDVLGVAIHLEGSWSWQSADLMASGEIKQSSVGLSINPEARMRTLLGVKLLCAALVFHAIALSIDWTMAMVQHRQMNRAMLEQLLVAIPDANSSIAPSLQMRRMLSDRRHSIGQTDPADFLPMVEDVASAIKDLSPASLKAITYGSGRVTIEINAVDEKRLQEIAVLLRDRDMGVDLSPASGSGINIKRLLTVTRL